MKGPRTAAAYATDGAPTKAALGFARSQGVSVDDLTSADVGGTEHLVLTRDEPGRTAVDVLTTVLAGVVRALRSGKNMRWCDPELAFTRPVRWLGALWGDEVIPVRVSTLAADRSTRVHRTAEPPLVEVPSAEEYLDVLRLAGIVVDPEIRRAQITTGAERLTAVVDGYVDLDAESGLVDQIVYLVEEPTVLLGSFDVEYLGLPEPVLATVMRKHQRYLPVRNEDGRLLPTFVAVANGHIDIDLVRAGNEAVLRARYEDASFFYRADRETPLETMRQRLGALTFTDKLGSMADRAQRIAELADLLAVRLDLAPGGLRILHRAASLVKFDLGSQMVTEMTSLAGVMARDYAQQSGEDPDVAQALYESELPRNTGDELPAGVVGAILSVADRLDLVVGLAATVGLPTGSSDPFAIRRAVLGLLAIFRTHPAMASIALTDGLTAAARLQPVVVDASIVADIAEFSARRLEQVLAEEGWPLDRVRAVMLHASRPHLADRTVEQLTRLVDVAHFRSLAEALQRSRRIVPDGTDPEYDPKLLVEPAELHLHQALQKIKADMSDTHDLIRFLEVAGGIVDPVTQFFDGVFVMAPDAELRRARLGLLAEVAELGTDVLDWQELRL